MNYINRLMAVSLFATGLLLLASGNAHANQGPYFSFGMIGMFLGIPALICLLAYIAVPSFRAMAGTMLLIMGGIMVAVFIYTNAVIVPYHNTWQWHQAKAYMEVISEGLSAYADSIEGTDQKYPVGDLTWEHLFTFLPGYNLPGSESDAHFSNFHYWSEDGKTYRIEADVYTRRPTWVWATPESTGPEEPEPRPSDEPRSQWHTIRRTSKRDADGVERTVHIRYWGPRPQGNQLPPGVDISQYQVELVTKLPPEEVYNKKLKEYQVVTNRYRSKSEGPFISPGPDGEWFTEDDIELSYKQR